MPHLDAVQVVQPIRLRLLGGLELTGPDGKPLSSILAQPKRVALLAYLAHAPGAFQRRDALLPIFWPEFDQQRARAALRRALHFLRQSLGEGVLVGRGDEEVGLVGERFWCDVTEFRSAVQNGRLEEALGLYKADLLRGFFVPDALEFEQWLDGERTRLRQLAARVAAQLSERLEARGALVDAIARAREACALEPASEPMIRRLVSLLLQAGDRTGAAHAWDAWQRRLVNEYALSAGPEARQQIETLFSKEAAARPAHTHEVIQAIERTSSSASLLWWRRRTRLMLAGALASAVAIVGVAAVLTGSPPLNPRHVLIADFVNETGDAALDPVGRRVADRLTAGLDQADMVDMLAPEFVQPSRYDVRAASPVTLAQLARDAGAGTLVTGAFYRDGRRLLFSAKIVDGNSGEVRLVVPQVSAVIDSVNSGIEALRLQVSGAVAALLDGKAFANKGTEHISRPPNLDAYVEYAAGRDLFTAQDYEKAIPHFFRAAALDTNFLWPLIHAQTALINWGRYDQADSLVRAVLPRRERLSRWDQSFLDFNRRWLEGNFNEVFRLTRELQDGFPGALPSYLLAVSSNRVNRPALAIRSLERTTGGKGGMDGWVGYWGVYVNARHMLEQHRDELRAARKAMKQYPDLLSTLEMEAQALAALGETAAVMRNLDLAAALSAARRRRPSDNMRNVGIELAAHGDTIAARAVFERAIAWQLSRPSDEQQKSGARAELAWLYLLTRRDAEAEERLHALALDDPDDLTTQGRLAVLAVRRGDSAEAQRIASEMATLDRPFLFGENYYWRAVIAAQLGQRAEAMALLRDAFAHGRPHSVGLHRDPLLAPLRSYAPFKELLRPQG